MGAQMQSTFTEATVARMVVATHQDSPVPLFDTYVDRYWTAEVGPAVVALARFVVVEGDTRQVWPIVDMARALGFGQSLRRLEGVVRRAESYRFVRVDQHGPDAIVIGAWSTVPTLPEKALRRLPERYVAELTAVSR